MRRTANIATAMLAIAGASPLGPPCKQDEELPADEEGMSQASRLLNQANSAAQRAVHSLEKVQIPVMQGNASANRSTR